MKKNKFLLLASALFLCTACGSPAGEHAHDDHEAEAAGHDDDHEGLIELADEQARHFGVVTDTVRPVKFANVIRCSGVVERSEGNTATVTAPSAGIVRFTPGVTPGKTVASGSVIAVTDPSGVSGGDSNRAAAALLESSRAEVARLEPLYKERLVTAAEYNAALSALRQAEATYSPKAATGKAVAPISGIVTELLAAQGGHVEAGAPLATISADNGLTLHAEVTAADYQKLSQVTDARIGNYTLSEHGGTRSGISSENGYACIYFTFANDGTILPGSGADVYLLGEPRSGVIAVPSGAITEQQGSFYVYELHSPGHYEKIAVTPGASDGILTEITSGLSGGEVIVTSGAMTVRLAESSGAIPEGHSHNH